MEDKNKDFVLPEHDFLAEQPPLEEEFFSSMPELDLSAGMTEDAVTQEIPLASQEDVLSEPEIALAPEIILAPEIPEAEILPQLPFEDSAAYPEVAVTSEPGITDSPVLTGESVIDPVFFAESADDVYAMAAPEENEPVADTPAVDIPAATQPFAWEEAMPAVPEQALEPQTSDTPEEPTTPSVQSRPVRKGRPKRKKGYGFFGIPHLLATAVWLVIILAIGTTLGRFLWVCAADVLAFGRESSKVSITITTNDTIEDIAQKLHDAGLVRYPQLFEFYASIAVDEGDIIPGTFEMDTLYDYHALVVQMGPRSSNRAVIEDVLIPEGYNCRQIFALLEEKGICTVAELEEYSANGEFADFWFLEGVERGDKYCLEGFLFPDTYDFYANSTPREALGKMLLGFEGRFTEDIYAQLPALNERLSGMMRKNGCSEEFIAAHQLDLRGLLTVASLIEEETASILESPTIASVIYNRLTQDLEYERYLGIDAAIIYATGDSSHIDTSIDSPYNTYTHAGLTPGPITNPGLDSIRAALNPVDTNYYYYVLNPETYLHDFSVTLEEHEQKVAKYKEMRAGEEE